jgi:hypothetical protein
MHLCAIPGCICRIPDKKLLCSAHFSLLSWRLQRMLYQSWNNGQPLAEYPSVRAECIAIAERRQQR